MTKNNQRFYKRENDDYLEELKKHVDLIFHYTRKIDEGDMVFVYPLAVSLRVILHQTKYSDSLLELLGKRIDINYHSTSEYLRDYSDIDYLVGLIEPCEKILFQDGEVQGRINIFIPKLNSPFMKSGEVTWLNYHQFYNEQPVFLLNPEVAKKLTRFNFGSVNRIKVTRRNIIEYFANKSGGAHIDDQPPYNLYQLAENISSMNYIDVLSDIYQPTEDKKELWFPIRFSLHAAIRQIAYEVLITLRKHFDIDISYNPDYHYIKATNFYDSKNTIFKHLSPIRRDIQK